MKEFLREHYYAAIAVTMGIIADTVQLTIGDGGKGFSTGEMLIMIFLGIVADDFVKRLNNRGISNDRTN